MVLPAPFFVTASFAAIAQIAVTTHYMQRVVDGIRVYPEIRCDAATPLVVVGSGIVRMGYLLSMNVLVRARNNPGLNPTV